MNKILTIAFCLLVMLFFISFDKNGGNYCRPGSASCNAARAAWNNQVVHPPVVFTLLNGTIYFPVRTTSDSPNPCVERVAQWLGERTRIRLLKTLGTLKLKFDEQSFIATETIETVKASGKKQFEFIDSMASPVAPDVIRLNINHTASNLLFSLHYYEDAIGEKKDIKETLVCEIPAILIDNAALNTLWQ